MKNKVLYASLIGHTNSGKSTILNSIVGKDISIKDLSLLIKKIVGYEGDIVFDKDKPDGTPRKVLDVTKLSDYGSPLFY